MKYLLLIYLDERAIGETEKEQCYGASTRLPQELSSSGQYLSAHPLHPASTATSFGVRAGSPIVTDGPFAETREQLSAYFLIDARNLGETLGIAARIALARAGTAEVRLVREIPRAGSRSARCRVGTVVGLWSWVSEPSVSVAADPLKGTGMSSWDRLFTSGGARGLTTQRRRSDVK